MTTAAKTTKNGWGGARAGSGRKPGFTYESQQRKFGGCKTKVARIPAHWDIVEIYDRLEMIESLLDDADREIAASAARTKDGKPHLRLTKLQQYVEQLRDACPKIS